METYDMLIELVEAINDGDLFNDDCEHVNYANPYEHCDICMVLNIATNTTEKDFFEETTARQRERIEELWEKL